MVEGLIKSLDEPDKKLDEIWAEESENRPTGLIETKHNETASRTTSLRFLNSGICVLTPDLPDLDKRADMTRSAGLFMAVALICAVDGYCDVYKWTDAEGRVHYGDTPDESSRAQTI